MRYDFVVSVCEKIQGQVQDFFCHMTCRREHPSLQTVFLPLFKLRSFLSPSHQHLEPQHSCFALIRWFLLSPFFFSISFFSFFSLSPSLFLSFFLFIFFPCPVTQSRGIDTCPRVIREAFRRKILRDGQEEEKVLYQRARRAAQVASEPLLLISLISSSLSHLISCGKRRNEGELSPSRELGGRNGG